MKRAESSVSLSLSLSLSVCVCVCVCVCVLYLVSGSVPVLKSDAKPAWSSLFLALSRDVAVYMHPDDNLPRPPNPQPNVLQLHRATTQANWPVTYPAPAVCANPGFGSRICVWDFHPYLLDELQLAMQEATGGVIPTGVILTGNAGLGKVKTVIVASRMVASVSLMLNFFLFDLCIEDNFTARDSAHPLASTRGPTTAHSVLLLARRERLLPVEGRQRTTDSR
jgi:hypothetical protein